MKPITISLNPTYLCNFRCKFCYLTPEQLSNKHKIEPSRLQAMLAEIKNSGFNVEHVDLYGGEIGLLQEGYLEYLHDLVLSYSKDASFNVVTNLYKVNKFFLNKDISLSVSYDFDAREHSDVVLANMLKINKPIAVLVLASPDLIKKDPNQMINFFNKIQNVESVEIKPYSSNQANQLGVTNKEYEDFIFAWLTSPIEKEFDFINEYQIEDSLSGQYNAFSDNHIYITPSGKFAALEFDKNDNEFFLEFNSFNEYLEWSLKEKAEVKENEYCKGCEYLGTCLTEHYRRVTSLDDSCNGFKNLLDKFKLLSA
jgi:MoaA/NifB/PqqE/SkfB family radical SAM enzyme